MEKTIFLTLRPSRLGYIRSVLWENFLIYFFSVIGIVLIRLLRQPDLSLWSIFGEIDWWVALIPVLFYLVFGTMGRGRFSITLSEGIIEGPALKDYDQRVRFAVDQLDVTAAVQRKTWAQLVGRRELPSFYGGTILFNEAVFSPAEVQVLLQALNIPSEENGI